MHKESLLHDFLVSTNTRKKHKSQSKEKRKEREIKKMNQEH